MKHTPRPWELTEGLTNDPDTFPCGGPYDSCPVCGSIYHVHCSKGCAICDDPKNPHPRFASRFCPGCKRSLCAQCFEEHTCR